MKFSFVITNWKILKGKFSNVSFKGKSYLFSFEMAQYLSEQLSADLNLPIKVCYDTLQLMKSKVNSFLKKYPDDPNVMGWLL